MSRQEGLDRLGGSSSPFFVAFLRHISSRSDRCALEESCAFSHDDPKARAVEDLTTSGVSFGANVFPFEVVLSLLCLCSCFLFNQGKFLVCVCVSSARHGFVLGPPYIHSMTNQHSFVSL